MSDPLRLAIVESSPEVHLAIAALMESFADFRIIGHARSLPELLIAGPEAIDVLVSDLRACVGQPLALGQLRRRYPGFRLVITTANGGPEYEEAITRLAADGWVHKTLLASELIATLRRLSP